MSGRHLDQRDPGNAVTPSKRHDASEISGSAGSGHAYDSSSASDQAAQVVTAAKRQSNFRVPPSPQSNSTGESPAKQAKVAIPRLRRDTDVSQGLTGRGGGRHRVDHACEPCRHRKTKCSGERPICRHCQDFKIDCYYADGKRDRVKKQFGTMAEKVAEYERLLKDLEMRVPETDARLIRASLDKAAHTEVLEPPIDTAALPSIENEPNDEGAISGAESEASAGAGSTGDLDRTEEDFTREGAKITGFMGKYSDITWLQRVKHENRTDEDSAEHTNHSSYPPHEQSSGAVNSKQRQTDQQTPLPEAADGYAVHQTSYHLDDQPIATLDAVDAYEVPPAETAHLLFTSYMKRVHPTFPVLGQVNLTAQFKRYMTNLSQRPPDKWLAIMNMIFSIAARYSHAIQADWRGDERDHLIYFSRARLLAINASTVFDHADLQQIQISGLMSFYLMCTGQINRSWTLAGIAIRGATALGLNLRNDSVKLQDSLKEIRYRLWWALYILEHRLCSLTGRVGCITNGQCTTPLPVPIDENRFQSEEGKKLLGKDKQRGDRAPSTNARSPSTASPASSSKRATLAKSDASRSPSTPTMLSAAELEWARDAEPSTSLYFLHLVQLSRITHEVFARLYNPVAAKGVTWSNVQDTIKELNESLESWHRNLPPSLDFRRKQRDREFYEHRISLGCFFYSAKQVVNRPCLCRLDRKIEHQSPQSHEFNRNSAMACVDAAQETLNLMPDEPNAVGLMSVSPWWGILHWMVQAATVLLLEISLRAHHMPEEVDTVFEASKKAIRWLHAVGEDNLSAARAWRICDQMLRETAKKIGRVVTNLPHTPPNKAHSSAGVVSTMSPVSTFAPSAMQQAYQPNPDFTSAYDMPGFYNQISFDPMMHYDQSLHSLLSMPMRGDISGLYPTFGEGDMDFMMANNYGSHANHHQGQDLDGHDQQGGDAGSGIHDSSMF